MTNKFLLLLVASSVAVMVFTIDQFLTCTSDTNIDDFYHILTLNENDQHARLGIARSYERLGEVETAVIKYEEALEVMERSDYWLQFQPGRIEETRSHIERLRQSLEKSNE